MFAPRYGAQLSQELVKFESAESWDDEGGPSNSDSDHFSYKASGCVRDVVVFELQLQMLQYWIGVHWGREVV